MRRSRFATAFLSILLAQAGAATARAAEPDGVRLERGRLTQSGRTVEAGAGLSLGTDLEVLGPGDATVAGPEGLRFRAIPQTLFRVERDGDGGVTLRLDRGAVSASSTGRVTVATAAGGLRAEGARFIARLSSSGLYVEHRQESAGRLAVAAPGQPATDLAVGAFRMVAVEADAAVAPAIETLPAEAAAPAADCEAPATTPAPLAQQPAEPPVLEPMEVAPSAPAAAMEDPAPAPAPAPPAEEEVEEEVIVVPPVAPMPPAPATEPPATAAPPVVPVPPVAPVAPARPVAPRAMPAPVVVRPAPCGPTCPPVVVAAPAPAPAPVAMRADAGPCCDRVGECMPIPFAIYGEGDACDVFSFRLGYVVVTLRPAHLVRVERMACGGVRITAPRAGDRLVMVVLDDNQVAYIGRSGSLVLSSDGQVDCFRGLVHLYGRAGLPCLHRERERDFGKDCEPHHGGKPPFGGR